MICKHFVDNISKLACAHFFFFFLFFAYSKIGSCIAM